MWGRIVSSVSNALDFNQATLSGCIDIICVRNPHTGELLSTPFHVRFGKAKLLRSREKIVTVTVNNKPTSLVMKLGAAGEAYFMQEVEDNVGVEEDELASPLCSPVHSPRRSGAQPADASLPSISGAPTHPVQGATLSTATSAVALEVLKVADPAQEPAKLSSSSPPSSQGESAPSKDAPTSSQSMDSTWRSAWGTAARYEATTAGVSDGSPAGGLGGGESSSSGRGEDGRAAVQFSLCGHVLFGTADEAQHDADVFKANIITWEALEENPSLWYHPSLVACFDRTPPYYPAKVALPLLASWLLFNRPLSLNSVKRLMTAEITYTDKDGAGWAPWQTEGVGGASGVLRPRLQPFGSSELSHSGPGRDPLHGATCSSGVNSDSEFPAFTVNAQPTNGKRLRRSLRPTPQQLESLDLKPGANSVCFTVSSSLQGEKSVCGTIYLWPTDIKIVVSDVDGTITRSDVLGQLMPIVGRDWSHTGVAELFTKIKRSGYLILYLTARAIGQADATRDYLFGLTQKERDKLPDGPLILSPDRLFPSFRREVIDRKPYIFKIAALRDIRSLFPANRNPFYAGFGNRESDHRAYIHVGIPEAKIFIIDTAGVIHHISNSTYARTYETMSEIAEHMFPPLKDSPASRGQKGHEMDEREEEEFNAFNYWSVAFEPRSEYGDSEGGSGDEGDGSRIAVGAPLGEALAAKSPRPHASGSLQRQQLPAGSGGGRVALNYYFGLDQTEKEAVRSPSSASPESTASAVACGRTSHVFQRSHDSPDAAEDPLGTSSSSCSSSCSSSGSSCSSSCCDSSSSSLSSNAHVLLEDSGSQRLLLSPREQRLFGPLQQQQSESLRRSASEGGELVALDSDKREKSCLMPPQQQRQPPQQQSAPTLSPGRQLLPSVVSLSSFRLGPLAFRRCVTESQAASVKESLQSATDLANAGVSSNVESRECIVQSGEEKTAAPLVRVSCEPDVGSSSNSSSFFAPAAAPGNELRPWSSIETADFLSSVEPAMQSIEASNVSRAMASEASALGAAHACDFPLVTAAANLRPPANVSSRAMEHTGGRMDLQSASVSSSLHIESSMRSYDSIHSKSRETASGYVLTASSAASAATVVGKDGATVEDANCAFAIPSACRMLAVSPSTQDKSQGPSASVCGDGKGRLWLPQTAREMRACSSTSAMLMALAQDTPRCKSSPEVLIGEPLSCSFSSALAVVLPGKSGDSAPRGGGGKSRLNRGISTEGFGSFTSFESADPTTSRCDSFASLASRPRTDDEAHMLESRQHQAQKQDVEEQMQQAGMHSDVDNDGRRSGSGSTQGLGLTAARGMHAAHDEL